MTRPLTHAEKAFKALDKALAEVNLAVAAGEISEFTGGDVAGSIHGAWESLDDDPVLERERTSKG